MNDRLTILSKLRKDIHFRAAYIKAKVGVLVPSQIRALRFRSDMPKQADLAKAADMWQSQISGLETPGAANMTLDMLARLAAVFRVGLIVKFVPFSEMLRWEQVFSQDQFDVVRLEHDRTFLAPPIQQQYLGANYSPATGTPGINRAFTTQQQPAQGIYEAMKLSPQSQVKLG